MAARAAVEAAIAEVDSGSPPHDLAHYRGRLVVDLRPRTRVASARPSRRSWPSSGRRPSWPSATTAATPTGSRSYERRGPPAALDGLAVAVTGPHGMPDDVRAAADALLETPRDVARALSALARSLEREG